MCRLLVVKSEEPIQLALLLTAPAHSIINQASDSRLRLDSGAVNADGFGVGWYPSQLLDPDPTPGVFKSCTPAWSDENLRRLAEKVRSELIFAHVRASTTGALTQPNCHPWRYGSLLWMHNGCISSWTKIIRKVQADLSDEFYHLPKGNTDSEWAFSVFLERLSKLTDPRATVIPHQLLRQAMLETISLLNSYVASLPPSSTPPEPSLLNFCVTDGISVVATRYISSRTEEAASLFFSTGSRFELDEKSVEDNGRKNYRMSKADRREKVVLIASEPLTFERSDWLEVPSQTCVVITPKNNLLKFPIIDQFFLPTSMPARREGFAEKKGFLTSGTANPKGLRWAERSLS
ncbi:glutamine amidotransferase [Pseudohyphozyma bogoriensis]|nr:glutamine amidotransferase [Pseudohyphozyma bogoriensis]